MQESLGYRTMSCDELLEMVLGKDIYAVYKEGKAPGVLHIVNNLACFLEELDESGRALKLLMAYGRLFRHDEKFRQEQFTKTVIDAARQGISIEEYITKADKEFKKSRTSS